MEDRRHLNLGRIDAVLFVDPLYHLAASGTCQRRSLFHRSRARTILPWPNFGNVIAPLDGVLAISAGIAGKILLTIVMGIMVMKSAAGCYWLVIPVV